MPTPLLKPHTTRWLVFSFVFALLLELLPIEMAGWHWLPNWVGVLVIYWTLHLPRTFGIGLACALGLLTDMASASLFGQHALVFSLLSYLVLIRQRQMVMYSMLQQVLVVLGLMLLSQALTVVVRLATGSAFIGWGYFAASFVAAAVWPLLSHVLALSLQPSKQR